MKHFTFVAGLAAVCLWAGCGTPPIFITSNPAGAATSVNSTPAGPTPLQYPMDNGRDNDIRLELPGYFTEDVFIPRGSTDRAVSIDLAPSRQSRSYQIVTDPAGAAISLDGARVGTSPAPIEVVFTRETKVAPWKSHILTVALANYQSESFRLSAELPSIGVLRLGLLSDQRVYPVSAVTREGQPLHADVLLDGKVVGVTPMNLPVTFRRESKVQPWPTFSVTLRVPGQYREEHATLGYEMGGGIRLTLAPLSEVMTTLIAPGPVMTPGGVSWAMTERRALGMLNTREPSDSIAALTPITNFPRQDLRSSAYSRNESINSFTVSPDGQNIIFGLTLRDADRNLYSNLYLKRADGSGGGMAQLTQGTRFSDSMPRIANDGSNYLVFASNRGDRSKPDIFRSSLIDNSLSGGISRLTNDLRFNFAPTYGEANRQVFYLSIEPNYPLAESQLTSIRINGSLPTQLSITAQEIDNSVAERVYFVRMEEDTRKKQIYSVQADGKLETALINPENLKSSNCFDPAPSPDGSRIAFVSDAGVDEHSRHNNDIYVMNTDGSGLQRLTQNGSDDIMPVWSPSEDGVLYFLSNRGGVYNIWRLTLRGGSNQGRPKASRAAGGREQ